MASMNICADEGLELNTPKPILQKVCRRCKTLKKITNFKMSKSGIDGRTPTCRKCYTNNPFGKGFKLPEDYERGAEKRRGRKHSLEWRKAQSKGLKRAVEKGIHPWKKNEQPHKDYLRLHLEYKLWRESVFELNGRFCAICLADKNLHIHHIKCFYKYPDLRTEITNGQVLCASCHTKETWKARRMEASNGKHE